MDVPGGPTIAFFSDPRGTASGSWRRCRARACSSFTTPAAIWRLPRASWRCRRDPGF